jgi:hypothetical protein
LGQQRTWRDQITMSALPPKADIRRQLVDVRFGPEADSCTAAKGGLFDHLVGGNEQRARHSQAKSGGCLLIDLKLEFDRLLDRQITRISAF